MPGGAAVAMVLRNKASYKSGDDGHSETTDTEVNDAIHLEIEQGRQGDGAPTVRAEPGRKERYISHSLSGSVFAGENHPQIEVSDLKQVMKEMDNHEKGFDRLLGTLTVMFLFFFANMLRYDVAFTKSVNTGVRAAIEAVTFGDDSKSYLDVQNRNEFMQWISALAMNLYTGDGLEDVCRLCALLDCDDCIPDSDDFWDNCGVCSYMTEMAPSCFDGTCSTTAVNSDETYPFGWDATVPSSCEDSFSIFLEKGMTPTTQHMHNYSSTYQTIPYSSTSGKISNNVKLGSMATLTWQRRNSSDCMNEAIQPIYGKCKDYGSLIKEDISTTNYYNSFVTPDGNFQFDTEVQANGIYIELGAYNFGGWMGYCLGSVLEATRALENAEQVDLKMILFNAQSSVLFSVVQVSFHFTPGGYVDPSIGITSFPVLGWGGETTKSEDFYVVFLVVFWIFLPIVALLYMAVSFLRTNRNLSWKTKYYILCSWLQKRINFWFFVNIVMALACAFSSLASSTVFFSLVQNGDISFGSALNASATSAVISQTLYSTTAIEAAVISINVANGMFFATTFTLMTLLLNVMEFHKRLALVKEVLHDAALDLAHFFFVFMIIMVILSIVCATVFGQHVQSFNSITQSFKAMIRIGLGDPGDYYEEMLELPNEHIGPFMIFSIQIMVGLVLLNIIISICVDAYLNYLKKFEREHYWTMLESLGFYLCRKILRLQQYQRSRSSLRKWQGFCCTLFSHKQHSSKTIALSVAVKILESTPCHCYYAKRTLRRYVLKSQEEKAQNLYTEVPKAKLVSELVEVKSKLENADQKIQRLTALLQLKENRYRSDDYNANMLNYVEKKEIYSPLGLN